MEEPAVVNQMKLRRLHFGNLSSLQLRSRFQVLWASQQGPFTARFEPQGQVTLASKAKAVELLRVCRAPTPGSDTPSPGPCDLDLQTLTLTPHTSTIVSKGPSLRIHLEGSMFVPCVALMTETEEIGNPHPGPTAAHLHSLPRSPPARMQES